MCEALNWCRRWLCATLERGIAFHGILRFSAEPSPSLLASRFHTLFVVIAAVVVTAVILYYADQLLTRENNESMISIPFER